MKMENEELSKLLNISNDLRNVKGDKLLDDLPVSDPEQTTSCLVANAFNYGCEVNPSANKKKGQIGFNNREDLEIYLNLVDDAREVSEEEDDYSLDSEYIATLP